MRIDWPEIDRTISVHMPNLARSVHPEGFLGEYGEQRAIELLVSLYKEQKQGDRRRKFARVDSEEFGRVRYLEGRSWPSRARREDTRKGVYRRLSLRPNRGRRAVRPGALL